MSQQEINFEEIDQHGSYASYAGYEGKPQQNRYFASSAREKLSGQGLGSRPSSAQRLALAIVSLVLLMFVIFGLTLISVAAHAEGWVAIPVLMVIFLFGAVAAYINLVFNRGH